MTDLPKSIELSDATVREAMIAALPSASEEWKTRVRAGVFDETALAKAARAGWFAGVEQLFNQMADDGK